MGRLDRELRLLSRDELQRVNAVLAKVRAGDIDGLQVKKLAGSKSMYRIRVGRLRVVYQMIKDGTVTLLAVRKRDENTYRDL